MPSKSEEKAAARAAQQIYDVVILGAGPAGLSAAIYARRANKSVLILENKTYGGQVVETTQIENYPAAPHISGPALAKKLYDQVMEFGADFEYAEALAIIDGAEYKTVKTDDGDYLGRTVIIATGSEEKKLGLPREDELTGRGVSYCAACDGSFFRGQDVAVEGGGNSALYSALYLADLAKTVYVIHRRDAFRADPMLIDKLKQKKNVKYYINAHVSALSADSGGHLSEITISPTGPAPLEIPAGSIYPDKPITLPVSGLFVAIGRKPDTKRFAELLDLARDGYIKTDDRCRTKTTGIFAAGDVREKPLRQIVTAASDGAIAATEAIDFLNSAEG